VKRLPAKRLPAKMKPPKRSDSNEWASLTKRSSIPSRGLKRRHHVEGWEAVEDGEHELDHGCVLNR
jgi:hypothetical protein